LSLPGNKPTVLLAGYSVQLNMLLRLRRKCAARSAIAEIARNVILNPFFTCDSFRSRMTAITLWQFSAVMHENVSDKPLFTSPNCSQLVFHLTYSIVGVINCETCPLPPSLFNNMQHTRWDYVTQNRHR
jgi:hypothetical protein